MNYTQSKDQLLSLIREGGKLDWIAQVKLTALLSFPSMMAQMVHIMMQYIDASMVGSLGAHASASIGLVSTTIWLFGSLCAAVSVGFYVQVAHKIGAKDFAGARQVLRQSFMSCILFALLLSGIGISISSYLPHWLGGGEDICHDEVAAKIDALTAAISGTDEEAIAAIERAVPTYRHTVNAR